VLGYTDSITREVRCDDAMWSALAARFNETEIFELAFTVGLAALVNRVHATFQTDVDERTAARVDTMELPPDIRPEPRR
jgi:alkylhydroperoxidase family enzyme